MIPTQNSAAGPGRLGLLLYNQRRPRREPRAGSGTAGVERLTLKTTGPVDGAGSGSHHQS